MLVGSQGALKSISQSDGTRSNGAMKLNGMVEEPSAKQRGLPTGETRTVPLRDPETEHLRWEGQGGLLRCALPVRAAMNQVRERTKQLHQTGRWQRWKRRYRRQACVRKWGLGPDRGNKIQYAIHPACPNRVKAQERRHKKTSALHT